MNLPQENEKNNQIFCYNGRINTKDGTIYVDFTGKFPNQIHGWNGSDLHQIILDKEYNNGNTCKNMAEKTIVSCFKQQIKYITKRLFKPILNTINNVASNAVQAYLEAENVNMQLVDPHNHRVNAAERAIQTFKNHFNAGLSTCNASFPSLLWNKTILQAQDYLNVLYTSQVNPKLSVYSVLEGIHDFIRHPWDPPGTRETIFNPPEPRTSFGPRAIDAQYIVLATQYYRCYNFFLPSTGVIITSGKATFYLQHFTVPKKKPMDDTSRIAVYLIKEIQRLRSKEEQHPMRHSTALEKLADIFNNKTGDMPMMNKPTHQISTQPKVPAIISTSPRVHQRTTWDNTKGMLTPYSRVIIPPNSKVTTPPTGPAEKKITHTRLV